MVKNKVKKPDSAVYFSFELEPFWGSISCMCLLLSLCLVQQRNVPPELNICVHNGFELLLYSLANKNCWQVSVNFALLMVSRNGFELLLYAPANKNCWQVSLARILLCLW